MIGNNLSPLFCSRIIFGLTIVLRSFTAVRYGRVPKRSRELSGSEDNPPSMRVSTPCSTPSTPMTPITPQMCSVASPTNIAPLAPDPSDLPGSTDLTVYDVILCVSQAHRTHCTYTEEITRNLMRKPISLPTDPVLDEECEVRFYGANARVKFQSLFFSSSSFLLTSSFFIYLSS